ncbi:Crp/Fnr family transcriptional regulator [Thermodesulfobacteriota bacterium]
MISLDFIKKVSAFNGLDDDQFSRILEGCNEMEYKKGERLFGEQEDAGHIWIVTDGQVDIRFDLPARVTSAASTVYSETATKTFGWSSFVPPYKYILSAYCAGRNCKVARVGKEYLLKLFESDSGMGYVVMSNIAGVISTRFHQMQRSSIDLSPAM